MSNPGDDPKQVRARAIGYLRMRDAFDDLLARRALEQTARELQQLAERLEARQQRPAFDLAMPNP
jgi:hypothetical protein